MFAKHAVQEVTIGGYPSAWLPASAGHQEDVYESRDESDGKG